MDASLPQVRALAIAGDRIAGGVGTHERALPSPERVDLGGRCVVPGFTDSHVHFPSWSLTTREVSLDGTRSLAETLGRVAATAAGAAEQGWIRGHGWRDGDWPPEDEPTRDALDEITGDVPTALVARDRHSLWLNSAALAKAEPGFAEGDAVVERDPQGRPTGILREQAAWRFRQSHLNPTEPEMLDATREGIRVANSRGITAIHDKDGGLGALRVWQRLRARGNLTIRVWQSLPHERLDELEALDIASGFGDSFVRIGYIKAFLDGTLASGTARLLDGTGVELSSRAELEDIIRRAAAAGFPVAVHAIGDRANRDALDAFETTRDAWATVGVPRIEHAQLISPDDIPRFGALGVAASVQFSHAPSDRDVAERRWSKLLEGAYAYRSLVETGALVANGSDAPIEELDPLEGIRAAVLRTLDDRPAWRPEQALTIEQALAASTANPPRLEANPDARGTLVPGKLADLVVLDRDPFTVGDLREVQPVATMVGGRWVFNPPPWD